MVYLYVLVHSEDGIYDTYDEVSEALDDFNKLAGENIDLDTVLPSIRTQGQHKFNDEYSIERIIA